MLEHSLEKRTKLIESAKTFIEKELGEKKEEINNLLDCFIDESIVSFKEGIYKIKKEDMVRKVKPKIYGNNQSIPKETLRIEKKSLVDNRWDINEWIHGKDLYFINEELPLYIGNELRFLLGIFMTWRG